MNHRFTENPAYAEYEMLLRELHDLMAAGHDESPEAEAVRDRMEAPASALSREEIARLKGLSADLYMLQGEEIFEPTGDSELTPERRRAALKEAWDRQDWVAALALLRKGPPFFTQPQMAFLRFRAYAELGHLDSALMFLAYAVRTDPQNIAYACLFTDLLLRLGRTGEALEWADGWLENSESPPALRIQAAAILIRAATGMPEAESRRAHQQVSQVLEAALRHQHSRAEAPDLRVYGYIDLGLCYEALGRLQEARSAYESALAINPDSEAALVARGLLRAHMDPDGAAQDFERAVERSTAYAAPYLYLAEGLLGRGAAGDYERCVALCDRVLMLTQDPELVAPALQGRAIAQFQLGAPVEQARANLRMAVDLAPSNEALRSNLERFERTVQARASGEPTEAAWQPPIALEAPQARRELRERCLPVGAPAAW
jgi:tetratricopeptide (TPR) repeat protein